ncbi:hypothetical protein IJJ12_03465 [bacterium]|nr:hypothetical protein [bacterium]
MTTKVQGSRFMPSIMIITPQSFADGRLAQHFVQDWLRQQKILTDSANFQLPNFGQTLAIDMVRDLQLQVAQSGGRTPTVFVLTDMDRCLPPAQNALLKLLEEPPTNVYLVLLAASDNRILPTVRSRCRVFRLTTAQNVDFSPSLAELGVANWSSLSASQLNQKLSDALTSEYKKLSKTDDALTQTQFTDRALSAWLAEAVALLDAGETTVATPAAGNARVTDGSGPGALRSAHLARALSRARELLRHNVSAKNVIYDLAVQLQTG